MKNAIVKGLVPHMKITANKIYIAVFSLILLSNIFAVYHFSEYAELSASSILPALIMLASIVLAILAYDFRFRQGCSARFLSFNIYTEPLNIARLIPKLLKDENFAFSPEYQKEFALTLFIYCAAIPFHIPVIFFGSNLKFLSSFGIFAIPQIIFLIRGVTFVTKEIKLQNEIDTNYEIERKEQEKLESIGKWK